MENQAINASVAISGDGSLRPRRRHLAAAFDLLDAGQRAPAPDLAVAGPARRPDVLRLRARGDQHDLVPPDVRGASQRPARRLENLEPVVASHGRIPGLVTQDRPRRQGAVPRSPAPSTPACVRSGCWGVRHCPAKGCAVITLPPSLPAQAYALPGHTAAGRASRASRRRAYRQTGQWRAGQRTVPSPSLNRLWLSHSRDEPAGPLSEPCAPIANATGCPACISMHCSRVRKCALMPPSAPVRHRWPACRAASAMAADPLGGPGGPELARQSAMGSQISSATSRTRSGPV